MSTTAAAPDFATLVREFFCQRLITQQNASARTVASYPMFGVARRKSLRRKDRFLD